LLMMVLLNMSISARTIFLPVMTKIVMVMANRTVGRQVGLTVIYVTMFGLAPWDKAQQILIKKPFLLWMTVIILNLIIIPTLVTPPGRDWASKSKPAIINGQMSRQKMPYF